MSKTLLRSRERLPSVPEICSGIAGGIALVALAGWLSGVRSLAGQWSTYVPISPSTAWAFLLLSGGLFWFARRRSQRASRMFAMTAVSIVSLLSLLVLAQFITGIDLGVEQLLSHTNELMGSTPLGRMSPVTAAAFLLESSALLLLIVKRWRNATTCAALLAAGAIGINAVVLIGYAYGAPLLYGGTIIPVALPTAVAFVLVGVGQFYLAVPGVPALSGWRGSSMRGILLRAFLPLILIFILVLGWLNFAVQPSLSLNPALWHSLIALIAGALIVVITGWIARRTGSEIERAQEAQAESEEYYRLLFENSGEAILFTQPDGTIYSANPEACRILGRSEDEIRKIGRAGIVDTNDPRLQQLLEERRRTGKFKGELNMRRKDGTIFSCELSAVEFKDSRGDERASIIFRDLTERKRAEEERTVIYEIIQGVISMPNLDEFLKLVHRSISQIVYAENCFVMLHDPVSDMNHFEFWVDKYDPPPAPHLAGKGFGSYVLRTGKPLLITEESKRRIIEAGGAEQIGSFSPSWLGVPLRTPSRTIGALVLQHYEDEHAYTERDLEFLSSVGDEIALAIERKRADEALSESEERYRDLVENAIDVIYTRDLDGNITAINRAAERVTGYTIREMLTMNIAQVIAPEYREKSAQMEAVRLAGTETTPYEMEIIAKDGRRIALEANTRIIEKNGVPIGVQGIARDITERKHLEEQFLQSQKMEGIGMLAGGIAHDFNNLLTAILGFSDLTLKRMPADVPFRHNIEEIKEAGNRAAALTGQLLAFSRKQILKPTVHNINTVIENQERMLRRIIRENIELKTVLDPELGNINADPVQIEQVIMNLAVNARDAMPEGGTLTLETQNVYLDEEYVSQHISVAPGPFVKMIVTDTGDGMDEPTQSRIFEPFFTTKEVGKGTGLGLSTVYGIVKQSGGDIMVYSEIGHGTTFKIYLPCVEANVQKPKWIGDGDENYSGTETILLVEDQDIVRTLVNEILTGNGYRVVEAISGEAALAVCDNYSEPVHMLLTDLMMPGMSGLELRDQLVKLRPDIKILVMSGYADDSIGNNGILDSDFPFIEKPFTPDGLARKVREVLES